jgi:enoyl-CoA hydratase/carnithine racemase
MTDLVEIVRDDSRIEIILDRPEKKNALTGVMYDAMARALATAEDDPNILSVIIAGRGQTFCAGNDLIDFQKNPPRDADSPAARYLAALSTSSKVIVAAVQGFAVGIGATTLLHCDHVVATEDATLQFGFVKMALVPEAASSLLLPRAVGALKAAELMLTGNPIPATEALSLGLVSRLVESGHQLAAAQTFCTRLNGSPAGALRMTKRLLRSETTGIAERMAEEGEFFRQQLASAEYSEAVRAFIEKRKPVFGNAAVRTAT